MAGERRPKHWCLPEGLAAPGDTTADAPTPDDAEPKPLVASDIREVNAGEPDEPEKTESSGEPMAIEEPAQPVASEQPAEPVEAAKPEKPPQPKRKRRRRARGGVRCPVCGNVGGKPDAAERTTCGTCGVAFLHKRPTLGELAKARDTRFARAFALPNHEERRRAKTHAGEVMRGFFQVLKGKPVALNGFGKSMLEAHCGLGMRLRAFQGYGWTVAGTEPSATAYEYSRRQSLDVTRGWLSDGRFGKTKFDLALFCASFGEMDDPHGTARQLREFLVRGGLVCVLREPMAGGEAATPADSRLFIHTPESIRRAFTGNKFTLVSEELTEGVGTFWFKSKTWRGT